MVTKTNYHMCRELDKELNFKPKHFGFLDGDEVYLIVKHFQIKKRSDIELQNLRDFVVMYYSSKTKEERYERELMDLMSGITGVIDNEKWNRGMEV